MTVPGHLPRSLRPSGLQIPCEAGEQDGLWVLSATRN